MVTRCINNAVLSQSVSLVLFLWDRGTDGALLHRLLPFLILKDEMGEDYLQMCPYII
jgi:hypothetical protein